MSTFLPFVPIDSNIRKSVLSETFKAITPGEPFTVDQFCSLANTILAVRCPGGVFSYNVCYTFLQKAKDLDECEVTGYTGKAYRRRPGAAHVPFEASSTTQATPSAPSDLEQAVMDLNRKIAVMLKVGGVEPEPCHMADPVHALEASLTSKIPGLPLQSTYKDNDGEVFCKVYGVLPERLIREQVLDTILKQIDVPVPPDANEEDKFVKVLDWISSHRFTPNGNNVVVALAGWKDDEVGTRQVFGPDPTSVDDLKSWITNAKRYAVETENLVASIAKALGIPSIATKDHFLEAIQRMRTQMEQDKTIIEDLQARDLARGLAGDSPEDEVAADRPEVSEPMDDSEGPYGDQSPEPNPFQRILKQLDDRGTNLVVQPATYARGGRIDLHDHFTFDCDGFDYMTLRTPVEILQDPEAPFGPLNLKTNDLLVIVAWKAPGLTNPHGFKGSDTISGSISSGPRLTARPQPSEEATA